MEVNATVPVTLELDAELVAGADLHLLALLVNDLLRHLQQPPNTKGPAMTDDQSAASTAGVGRQTPTPGIPTPEQLQAAADERAQEAAEEAAAVGKWETYLATD